MCIRLKVHNCHHYFVSAELLLLHSFPLCFYTNYNRPVLFLSECEGSNLGLMHSSSSPEERYESYRMKYENCTLVRKNLEIIFIELTDEKYDFSFLENIREVGGYVLIYGNFVSRIRLTKLRVIRGMMKYIATENDQIGLFTLYVSKNSAPNNNSIGLQELQMPSLVGQCRATGFLSCRVLAWKKLAALKNVAETNDSRPKDFVI